MRNIKENERVGKQVEDLIAKKFPDAERPFKDSRGPFDIETSKWLIEVKSCQVKTKGRIRKGDQYMQTGRFGIFVESHKNLRLEAEKRGKQPRYIFVICIVQKGQVKIVEEKVLSWKEVDEKIKGRRAYKRRDGAGLKMVPHTMVFEQGGSDTCGK